MNVADTKTGEMRLAYVSIDRLTNEIVDVPTNKVRIPNRIGLTELSKAEQEILRAGLALPKEVTLKGGRKFEAMLQVNADKRVSVARTVAATWKRTGEKTEKSGSPGCYRTAAEGRRESGERTAAQPLVDERGRKHTSDRQMEGRQIHGTAEGGLCGG